jgi:peptidoglycan/LPS O-acetylase OafA/YrhL
MGYSAAVSGVTTATGKYMSGAVQREPFVAADDGAAVKESGPPKQEFFESLESLRGLAAFLVVLYHLPPWYDPLYNLTVVRHSYLMVDFFFVLSGFVLYHSYAGRIRDRVSMLRFVVLRLGRLYPVHLVFMLPFLAIEVAKYLAYRRYGFTEMSSQPALSKIGGSLLSNLLLVQGLGITSNDPALNFPNWSISTEFYAYLVFGFGLLFLSRRGFLVFSAIIAAVCVGLLVAVGVRLGDVTGPLRCLAGFMTGCLTRAAYQSLRKRSWKIDWPVLVMLVALLALNIPWKKSPGTGWWEPLFFPLAAVLIVTTVSNPSSLLNKVLMSRTARWLGAISYSLYMCHAIVQWLARQVFRKVLHHPEIVIDGVSTSRLGAGAAVEAWVAVTVVTLGVAWLSHLLIENPSRNLARRWVGNRWPSKGVALKANA